MTVDNPFRRFWDLGYRGLLPIVPPGSPISENSTLVKRAKDIGKVPGVRNSAGKWASFPWLKHETVEDDLDRWHDMGAGVGIRTGGGLVAVDIDTLEQSLADDIDEAALVMLGRGACRIGRWPKRLRLYRCSEEIPYQRVKFDGGLVELLSDDRQFVAHGIHPGTGKPYEWPGGIPRLDDLPLVDTALVAKFFAAVAEQMPAAEVVTSSLAKQGNADPAQLAGSPDDVRRAVAALPNTTALFPGYQEFVEVAQAIKGALPDDDATGLELFQDWAAKWEGGNDPDYVEATWRRVQPSRSIGAQYLYHLAGKHGGFEPASTWFTSCSPAASNPFDQAPGETTPALEPIKWANPATWRTTEAPPLEWEVTDFIPRGKVTLLYGDGGVGKTLAIHQYAVSAAAGREWLGQRTRPARVMCVFCEDDNEELHRRHRAILRAGGVDNDAADDNLRIVSRAGEDNILANFSRANGAMQKTPFWHQLREEAADWRADVIVLDTIADIFGGSEIDRTQVNTFIKVALAGLRPNDKASLVALGHPSVAGRSEGRSGSTAWSNAARSRLYLRRPKGKEKSNFRELEGMKANHSALGSLLQIKWQAGAFALVAESKPGIDLNALNEAVAVLGSGAGRETVEGREERAVLRALAVASADRRALNLSPRSGAYAPKVLLRDYADLVEGVRADCIESVVAGLVRRGAVRPVSWKDPGHRNTVSGYEVVTADQAGGPLSDGVFA